MAKYRNTDILKIENIQSTYFLCTWRMTTWCNYHCPYCINAATRENQKLGWIEDEDLIKKAKQINNLISINNTKNLPVKLKIIGGEISFNDLPRILDAFTKIDKLVVITNFSRELTYFKNLYIYCKNRAINLMFTTSYHNENIDFISKFIELTTWCRENKYKDPQATFVITKDFNFNLIAELQNNKIKNIKLIKERGIDDKFIEFDAVTNNKFDYYAENIKTNINIKPTYKVTFKDGKEEYFNNLFQFLNDLDDMGFKADGYYCNASHDRFIVMYDDQVYLNNCHFLWGKSLGTIWDSIVLSDKDVYCDLSKVKPTSRCTLCSTISVWRDK